MLASITRISPVAGVLLGIVAGIAVLTAVSELDCRLIPWGKRRKTLVASLMVWFLTILPAILAIIAISIYGFGSLFWRFFMFGQIAWLCLSAIICASIFAERRSCGS